MHLRKPWVAANRANRPPTRVPGGMAGAVLTVVYEPQKAYAAKVIPARRCMFPPYSFLANYDFPPATK